jgi:PKD repeat protein
MLQGRDDIVRKLILTCAGATLALLVACDAKAPVGPTSITVTTTTSTTSSTTSVAPTMAASFSISPTAGAVGQQIFVNASGSSALPGRRLVSFDWDFGDGVKKSGPTSQHDYDAPGIFTIRLTVTDDAGQTASSTGTVTIGGSGTPPLTTTTTSVPVASTAARYTAPPGTAIPEVPADLTLFLQLLFAGSSQPSLLDTLPVFRPAASKYSVTGTYTTAPNSNSTTPGGQIKGEFEGTTTPALNGTFTGVLTPTTPSGCTSERPFNGTLGTALIWTATGAATGTCTQNPMASVNGVSLVKNDAPPSTSTTTSSSTTTTSMIIPPVNAGSISVSPTGTGLASATLFTFRTQPSGGVPPYSFSWNFGDSTPPGTGNPATHTFAGPGTFSVALTVSDSRGVSAQAPPVSVTVGSAAGTWNASVVSVDPAARDFDETIVIDQKQSVVTATINDIDPDNKTQRNASGPGKLANPRSLEITLTYTSSASGPFSVTFQGTFNEALDRWTGTVSGYRECPTPSACNFSATRAPIVEISLTGAGAGGSGPAR